MIETINIELPFEKITYLDRPEFHTDEKDGTVVIAWTFNINLKLREIS